MQDSANIPGARIFSNEALLLWVAILLAVVFIGLLAFDLIKRRRRASRRRRSEPEGLRAKLLKPIHRAQALQSDVQEMLHERARRKRREERPPPETRP
jgi:hypothetical protein